MTRYHTPDTVRGDCGQRGWCDSPPIAEAQLRGTAHCANPHCVLCSVCGWMMRYAALDILAFRGRIA